MGELRAWPSVVFCFFVIVIRWCYVDIDIVII